VDSCTRGLWMWGTPIQIEGTNLNIILIDSEGNSAVDRTSSYDAQLFTLLVLISSVIVYNRFY